MSADEKSVSPVCAQDVEEHWLRAHVDGVDRGINLLVLEHVSGRYLVREIDLIELGLPLPPSASLRHQGEFYLPAGWIAGMDFHLRPREEKILIQHHPESGRTVREPFPRDCLPALPDEVEDLLLTVKVNEQTREGVFRAARDADSEELYLDAETLEDLRFRAESLPGRTRDGRLYHPLGAIEGLEHDLDMRRMDLNIEAPVDAFSTARLRREARDPGVEAKASPGAFFNYELFSERRYPQGRDAEARSEEDGGLYELGIFGGRGLFTTSGVFRSQEEGREWVHLESSLQFDNPARMTTTTIGDALGDPGSWGNTVRFGGVSWGTDFSTRPGFISFPIPSIMAETPAPASVDVYVNDVLRHRDEVPTGPFVVDDIPVVQGSGEVRLVTRDVLGREHVTTQSLYTSRSLLRSGLHEFQYSLGQERLSYGQESFDYGEPFAVGNHRYGFTDWLTGEFRLEAAENWQSVGLGGNIALPGGGVLDVAMAASEDSSGRAGQLQQLGLERRGRRFNFGLRLRETRDHFTQLGEAHIDARERRIGNVFAGINLGRLGAFSLNYAEQRTDGEGHRLASARYSARVARRGSLNISALRALDDQEAETSFQASLTIPFGSRSAISESRRIQGDRERQQTTLRRSTPVEGGAGFRAVSHRGDLEGQEIHGDLRTEVGSYRLAASRFGESEAYRARARGGVALLGGRPFLSDWIFGSFAAVEVPGLEDVPVYRDNLPVSRTNSSGWALVSGLRAYESNQVRLDESELPMSVQIESARETVVPRRRSGMVIPFDVRSERSALVQLELEDGEAVPAGATVHVDERDETHPVGWGGMVYLTGLPEEVGLEVHWNGEACLSGFYYPDTEDPLPEIGPLNCQMLP